MSVLLQEAISDGRERLGGELLGAFALQVAVEGGDGYSGVNCVALRVKGGAVGHAKKTAARVGMDIGTLGGKLGGIDRHDIAIAWVEERGKRGGGRGLGDGIAKLSLSSSSTIFPIGDRATWGASESPSGFSS